MLVPLLRKAVLPLYRTFSLFSCYTILLAILGYGAAFVFYIASSGWVSPFIVNSTDDKVLTLTAQLTGSRQALAALQLNQAQSQDMLTTALSQVDQLSSLDRRLDATIRNQKRAWTGSTADLTNLHEQKAADNTLLSQDAGRTTVLKNIIEKNLAAGLVTKGDAQAQIIQLDQFVSATTDSKVAETLLTDSVRQHAMTDLNFITVLAQKAQLESQIAQLTTTVVTLRAALKSDVDTINVLNTSVATAQQSPYAQAVNSSTKLRLAVVPYGHTRVKVGDPLYNCLLGTVICRRAGTVTAVFPNEELFEHPILRINMRGYIVKIDVDMDSMNSKTLAVGSKPFFL
ncbi:MAG: hypothetical protein WA477_12410 [Candidatus Sulfotelmatobacter sp.]